MERGQAGIEIGAVVVAAGRGERFGASIPKQFLPLAGRPLLAWTVEAVASASEVGAVVVVLPPGWPVPEWLTMPVTSAVVRAKLAAVVEGGPTRQESVARGVAALATTGGERRWRWVAVHDGARPLVTPDLFRRVVEAACAPECGAAVAALPMSDTVKRELREGLAGRPAPAGQGETGAIGELAVVAETVDRNGLWTVQTPQVVRVDWYEEALRQARASGLQASDEAGLLETAGFPVRLIPGERTNIKVTVPEDLELAEAILALRQGRRAWSGEGQREEQRGEGDMEVRVGLGTDVHRLVGGRPLVLGGVTIPFDLGLAGHSDADVLTHAVIDACLGAAGLGDIGRHFPDTDPRWKGANSLALLRQVRQLLQANGWLVVNVDTVVSAQRPKLAPYADAIVSQLAAALGIDKMQMNFKAKTGEGLGWVGTGEGMAAEAVVLLQRGTAGGLRR